MAKITETDINMKIETVNSSLMKWHDLRTSGLFFGYGSDSLSEGYSRLNLKEKAKIENINPDAAWLSTHTAGISYHFETDSKNINIKVELAAAPDMPHMPATGQCGVDIYNYESTLNDYVLHNTARFDIKHSKYEAELAKFEDKKLRRYIINLPLYMAVKSISMGFSHYTVLRPVSFKSCDRVIVYGTSIVQGGCVSRPGIAATNILSRRLGCEVINLGFSGVCFAEKEMAEIIGARENQRALIIDCEPNAGIDDRMQKNLPQFLDVYRSLQKETTIILMSRVMFAMDLFDSKRASLRKYYKRFLKNLAKKYYNVHFCDGSKIFKDNFTEYTVDGIHPTDAGNMLIAKAYLKEILKAENIGAK